ncbi:MAG: YfhO family protein [Lachnospiraceae bacterium]|nr:YfhO family protein [Lachnospiraceae bacterium]
MNFWKRSKKLFLYLLAFFIPVLFMSIVFLLHHVYPIGDNTLLIADMNYQYIDYYSYFKNTFFSNDNLIYTFSKNMGGDMIGLTAYYLLSPFNLIFLFFKQDMLPVAVMVIYLIKIGFCSLTCNYYLNKKYGMNSSSLIFSSAYAMMSYFVVYMCNLMYFDCFILLPLIVYGIEGIVLNKKQKNKYSIFLSLALISNYYIGFMLCIFSLLYFIYTLVLEINSFAQFKEKKGQVVQFIYYSVIGGGIASFIIIPTLFSLQDEKSAVNSSIFHIYRNFSMIDLFSNFYTNAFNGNISSGLPQLFCGIMTPLFMFLFFLNKNISKKEKIASFFFLSVLFISLYVSSLNMVWHGFNYPISFPYRYSFLISFTVICLGYKGYQYIEGVNAKKIISVGFVFFIYSLYLLITKKTSIGLKEIIFDSILMIIILGLCSILLRKKQCIYISFLLGMIQLLDLSVNIYTAYPKLDGASMSQFKEEINDYGNILSKIKNQDNSFYRIEKTFRRTHNDALQFQYNGLSHYSSVEKVYIFDFMEKLGFRNNGNWAFYNNGSTTFVDSLLGVKYLISQFDTIGKPYLKKNEENGFAIFQNPYALNIGIGASKYISQLNMEEKDLFLLQNKLASAITGEREEIFIKAEIKEIKKENLKEIQIDEENKKYKKIKKDEEAYIEFVIPIEKEDMLMAYFRAPDLQKAEIYINQDNKGDYFNRYRWDIIDLGNHELGKEVHVKIILKEEELILGDYYFYYEIISSIENWFEKVWKSNCQFIKSSSSHLIGTVFIEEGKENLLLTIPFEKAWKIKIDNQKVNPKMILGAIMYIPISPGNHNLELVYVPQGAYIGVIISLVSIILYIFMIFKKNEKK